MIISKPTKRNNVHVLWLFIAILTISCGAAEPQESPNAEIAAVPQSEQPVEYGASLNEWVEATQADQEQIESNNATNSAVEPTLELVPTVTLPAPATETVVTNASTETAAAAASPRETSISYTFTLDGVDYQQVMWDALVPADFTANAIMAKYEDQLGQLEDGSPQAFALYAQMQEEFNNAPVNETMDGELIRLPGFIAPLEYTDDLITEFLLVPYFGACIHTPPPPANQTVYVKLPEGQGIKFEDAYSPFWVMGQLTAEGSTTDLAEAGYYIEDALIELYSDES